MSPSGWTTARVGDLLARPLRNGISPSSKGTVTGEVLTLSAVTGGRYDANARKSADFATEHSPKKTVSRSDLLICRGNGNINLVGRARRPTGDLPHVAFPDTMIGATFDARRVDLDYVEHVWESQIVREQVEGMARSTNGTHKINQTMVENIEIPLPPIEEQRRIASVLDAADELRAKRREALDKLDVLTQAIFFDMFGDRTGDDSVELGTVADVQGGLQVTSKRKVNPIEVPYLRVANVYRGYLDLTEIKTMRVTEREVNRTVLQTDDLLVVEGHGNTDEIGRVARWDGSIGDCVHQNHLIRVRCDLNRVLPRFVESFMNSDVGHRALEEAANTTSGLNTISTRDVRAVALPVPSMTSQEVFAKRLCDVDALRNSLNVSSRTHEDLYASLQQRAFRGDL